MTTNNAAVVTSAVSLVNAANQTKVNNRGAELVNAILERQAALVNVNKRITDLQTELAKIAGDTITPSSIGVSLPTDATTDTASQKTVRAVIDNLNKTKQDDIQYKSSNLVRAITNEQASVTKVNKDIADLQAKLNELAAETVTEAQVAAPAADTTASN